jgi:hypothetical protein
MEIISWSRFRPNGGVASRWCAFWVSWFFRAAITDACLAGMDEIRALPIDSDDSGAFNSHLVRGLFADGVRFKGLRHKAYGYIF